MIHHNFYFLNRLLDEFMYNNPNSVFKFAHRINLRGHSQGSLEALNYNEYIRLSGRVTINSLAEQINNLAEQVGKLSVNNLGTLKELLNPNLSNILKNLY